MARVRLPRLLESSVRDGLVSEVQGNSLGEALMHLFEREPALKPHLMAEDGAIRRHVLIFVDGRRADLDSVITDGTEIRVLQAVSGG